MNITADEMQKDYLFVLYKAGMVTIREPARRDAMQMAVDFARANGISPKDFFGKTRLKSVAHPRQDCMRMLREKTGLSMPQIGRIFGRDHTTVLYAIRASKARGYTRSLQ